MFDDMSIYIEVTSHPWRRGARGKKYEASEHEGFDQTARGKHQRHFVKDVRMSFANEAMA